MDLTTDQVQQMIKDALDQREVYNQSNLSPIPNHVHNGTDSAIVDKNANGIPDLPVSIANGGTGQITANTALNALLPSQTANSGKFFTTDGSNSSWGSVVIDSLTTTSFVAGEALATKDALVVGDGATVSTNDGVTNTQGNDTNVLWTGQTFTVGATAHYLNSVSVQYADNTTGTGTISIRRTSGGLPTGADLASFTYGQGNSGSTVTVTLDMSGNPVSVSSGEVIAVILHSPGNGSSGMSVNLVTPNPYSGGQRVQSSNGTSWSSPDNHDCFVSWVEVLTLTGKVYKSNATTNNVLANAFVGFASASCNAGDTPTVIIDGRVSGLSGLTTGATVYLSNTSGQVSSSAGSQSRKIGLAIGSTALIIKHDNP